MTLVKGNVRIGVHTRFGPKWPGKRCLAKTRRGTACQRAAYKHNGRCALHGGRATGPKTQRGLQRISEANLKHGRQTKDKLAAQRHGIPFSRLLFAILKFPPHMRFHYTPLWVLYLGMAGLVRGPRSKQN